MHTVTRLPRRVCTILMNAEPALQFMNSVETVLETYGGPSEAWEYTPTPYTLHPQLYTPNPNLSTLNPQPSTLDPRPSTLNPQP